MGHPQCQAAGNYFSLHCNLQTPANRGQQDVNTPALNYNN